MLREYLREAQTSGETPASPMRLRPRHERTEPLPRSDKIDGRAPARKSAARAASSREPASSHCSAVGRMLDLKARYGHECSAFARGGILAPSDRHVWRSPR